MQAVKAFDYLHKIVPAGTVIGAPLTQESWGIAPTGRYAALTQRPGDYVVLKGRFDVGTWAYVCGLWDDQTPNQYRFRIGSVAGPRPYVLACDTPFTGQVFVYNDSSQQWNLTPSLSGFEPGERFNLQIWLDKCISQTMVYRTVSYPLPQILDVLQANAIPGDAVENLTWIFSPVITADSAFLVAQIAEQAGAAILRGNALYSKVTWPGEGGGYNFGSYGLAASFNTLLAPHTPALTHDVSESDLAAFATLLGTRSSDIRQALTYTVESYWPGLDLDTAVQRWIVYATAMVKAHLFGVTSWSWDLQRLTDDYGPMTMEQCGTRSWFLYHDSEGQYPTPAHVSTSIYGEWGADQVMTIEPTTVKNLPVSLLSQPFHEVLISALKFVECGTFVQS